MSDDPYKGPQPEGIFTWYLKPEERRAAGLALSELRDIVASVALLRKLARDSGALDDSKEEPPEDSPYFY